MCGSANKYVCRLWLYCFTKFLMNICIKILTESRVYSPLSVIFYAYLGILPPLLKNAFLRPHHQMWTENSFFFVYSGAKSESQTSNRHGFLRVGVVSALRRSSRFKPFFLGGDFRILLFDHLGKLFFAFFSCVGIDIKLFAFAVWQFRRITPFQFLFADSKYAPRSGTAYLRLFRLCFYRTHTDITGMLSIR